MGIIAMKALVVEDEAALLTLYGRILQNAGYEVMFAADGNIAIQILDESAAPALIVLDIRMPNRNGFDVLQYLQTYPDIEHIHVIIASASRSYQDYVQMLPSAQFLLKPVLPTQLKDAVTHLQEQL